MKTLQERFESKYDRKQAGCWLWNGAQHQYGYGHIRAHDKISLAHRVSYQLYVGRIPDGMCVLHRCDVPQCVNPEHLFLGSQLDNLSDMHAKGRASGPHHAGALNPQAKLTAEHVVAIRADKRIYQVIANEFGVSRSAVKKIKTGKTWKANG